MKQIVTLCVVGCLLLTGCGTTAKFVYPANPQNLVKISDEPKCDLTVAVVPFEEMRADRNSQGTLFLYLVPVMPFGWLNYDRPDAARMFMSIAEFDFDMGEDLAKAAAASLRQSGLFKDAYFSFSTQDNSADWVFCGETRTTHYKGTMYSYGVSAFCPYLWMLGLPCGSSRNDLGVDFVLKEKATGKVVWRYSADKTWKIVQGLYYRFGHDTRGYAQLMEETMNEAIGDLNAKLPAAMRTGTH